MLTYPFAFSLSQARHLLKSVTSSNPKHGPGWVAAARLEEVAGKLQAARQLMVSAALACCMLHYAASLRASLSAALVVA